jgi:hypothetical protein
MTMVMPIARIPTIDICLIILRRFAGTKKFALVNPKERKRTIATKRVLDLAKKEPTENVLEALPASREISEFADLFGDGELVVSAFMTIPTLNCGEKVLFGG